MLVSDFDQAVDVLTRGIRDNPNLVAGWGNDPTLRLARLGALLRGLGSIAQWEALVARDGTGSIVGVLTMTRPGECRLSSAYEVDVLSRLYAEDPEAVPSAKAWLEVLTRHDPREEHWHCGPIAVKPEAQATGVGSELLRVFCAQLDAGGQTAYLETDAARSLGFCERFGFDVVAREEVFGVTNWFMRRLPRARHMDEQSRMPA